LPESIQTTGVNKEDFIEIINYCASKFFIAFSTSHDALFDREGRMLNIIDEATGTIIKRYDGSR
jgi:hypothetical protein